MNFKYVLFIIGLLLASSSFAQNMDEYRAFIKIANHSYDAKDYQKSADNYKLAFDQLDGKAIPKDRYNAACSYALAGDVDQSFYHLLRLAEGKSKYDNYGHVLVDPDLKGLYEDKRWTTFLDLVKANKEEAEKDLDKPLVKLLDNIHEEDQKYRKELDGLYEKFGADSKEVMEQWAIINEKDSINLIKVKEILDNRGWLGREVVGKQGNTTLFLVIQHSDIDVQLAYLPMMREAVKEGNAKGSSLALLEDRVALRQGGKQVYGSQIFTDQKTGEHYVAPLENPESVNEKRSEVGLGPIEDYISHWGMTWDVAKHKERIERIEKEEKALEKKGDK